MYWCQVGGVLEGEGSPSPFLMECPMPHLQNGNMSQRHKMTRSKSKKSFRKHAGSHGKNYVSGVMRGGIRF
ncbi:nonstructural protein [Blackfly microvirus SF02]|uniref:Nonstructural protein n=1 Tax=Blackfly microvirus SF02 TaxID=2576452 RepID=A0A4P8PTV4_9VIRU|nr:nonstructural protein [Blackfly microvirus SF02]